MDTEKYLLDYYSENGKKLRFVVNRILKKFPWITDKNHFYSLANEIFVDVLKRYDGVQDFNGFLYSCLERKIKTEITRLNRLKRTTDRMSISIESPIGEDGEKTIRDLIEGDEETDSSATGNIYGLKYDVIDSVGTDAYEMIISQIESESRMEKLFENLSKTQRKVLTLVAAGYKPSDIQKMLHINAFQYGDSLEAVRSYKSVKILIGG